MAIACVQKFNEICQRDSDGVAFCLYCICSMGAQVDHQYGRINGLAIN